MTPKDMLTNPYFCPIPWTGLMYNFNGEVKNCIRSAGPIGNIKDQPIEQILVENNQYKQINILNQTPVDTCHTCYDLERGKRGLDIISDRVFYIRELKHIPIDTYKTNNFDLQTVDVRWTNLCNFACVYCEPKFSSKWASELNIIQNIPTEQHRSQFKNYILENAKKLKHVYLAGGEPLLMKENLELLALLDPNVNLRINTNLSKVDTPVFDRICEFKNVHWIVSTETTGAEFEYIRHGGKWQDFLDNLMHIKQLDHKITFNMLYFLLNYRSLFNTVEYFQNLGFHNNAFVIGALLRPEYLNIRHLPDHVLNYTKQTLTDKINARPGYLLEDSYRNLLSYIQEPLEKNLTNSFEQLDILDKRRNLNSEAIFTDLYTLKGN
jgi:MoaA/NifB/PqqE/SkfB family radical SAM enzyme